MRRRDFLRVGALAGAPFLFGNPQRSFPRIPPAPRSLAPPNFTGTELLGRPTDKAITVNAIADVGLEAYFEYGAAPSTYTAQTTPATFAAGDPIEMVINGLQADTRYYYRMRCRDAGSSDPFDAREEHTFHTQRPRGEAFTFTLTADPHMDTGSIPETYTNALLNARNDNPDFHIDLGDTFMSEKLCSTYSEVVDRHLFYRPYFGLVCQSAPLFLVLGNHEGELGWSLDGTADCMPIWATTARKLYYPNPTPDDFYSGDATVYDHVGVREGYYAWEWGDALFVALDPYWHTTRTEVYDDANWQWTLGYNQYSWLAQNLEQSDATFKFVFCHHLVGGAVLNGRGRGGIEYAPYYEWGGRNLDGTWGFADCRPGWEAPILQLLVDNRVSAFFHGHDHFYAKQDLDGIVYQEVPQPSHGQYNVAKNAIAFGYLNGVILPNSGHLRITVSSSQTTVEYVRAYHADLGVNGEVAHTYTISPHSSVDSWRSY
jgi:hypothetical protein